jgi:hypothetical protein
MMMADPRQLGNTDEFMKFRNGKGLRPVHRIDANGPTFSAFSRRIVSAK